jgi:peptidoglycan/LPS O-acetylase OafA/YrhL
MDALATGALVALAMRREGGSPPAASPRLLAGARVVAPAAGAAVLAIWYLEDPFDAGDWSEPVMQTAGFTTLALGFGAVVALAAGAPPDAALSRIFSTPVLRMFGRYSYALYLFHVPIRRYVRDAYFPVADFPTWFGSPLPGQLVFYVVATAPALLLAWVSWHVLEKQLLKLTRFFPYGRAPASPTG